MIKRIIASIVIFITLSSTSVYALDFSYNASIDNSGDKRYKAIKLTSEIYNNILGNMADIVLYDKNNEPIPYFINSFVENEIETKKNYEMKIINSFVKDNYFYYDYTLESPKNEDVTATSIEVQTDKESFAKEVEIFGGYDNVRWEKIQDDILYNVDGNKKLEISFDSVKKYTFYRFKISNNLEKVSFSSVALKYNQTLQKKEYFTDIISPNFTTEERGNTTVINIEDLKNLKLSSITLKTDSIFKRNVTFNGRAFKMLYNLDFESTKYRDLTIQLDNYRVDNEKVELLIENKDDKPIKILGFEAKCLVDEIVFGNSESSTYTLKFGNSEINIPKSYDISNYKEQILKEGYDVLSIKKIIEKQKPDGPTKTHYDYKLFFNIAVLVVALVLGAIILRKLKK